MNAIKRIQKAGYAIDEGLDGLETFHPSHSLVQKQSIQETAKRYGLFITGGSDTHGFYSERIDAIGCEEFFMYEDHPLLNAAKI